VKNIFLRGEKFYEVKRRRLGAFSIERRKFERSKRDNERN